MSAKNDDRLSDCCNRLPLLTEALQPMEPVDNEPQSKSHFTCAQFYEEKIEAMRHFFPEVRYCYGEANTCTEAPRRRPLPVGSLLTGEQDCV